MDVDLNVWGPKLIRCCVEYLDPSDVPPLLSRIFGWNHDASNVSDATALASASVARCKRKEPEEEDNEDEAAATNPAKRRKVAVKWVVEEDNNPPRLAPHLTDTAFKEHFRMSRSTVERLLTFLAPSADEGSCGRPPVKREIGTLLSLWTLGNREPFSEVALRFGLIDGDAYGEFYKFYTGVCAKKEEFIVWPRGDGALRSVKAFSETCGASFPPIVGCAGVTSIVSHKYRASPAWQCKRDTYFRLRAICDSSMTFFDVFAEVQSDDGQVWISLTEKEKLFNSTPGSARNVIKRAFGHFVSCIEK